ncbi:MAG TPA: diguanylate cyclase [Solirubrobacteraceae bacterium]|nr:diguanylate cyclase [Solirubrobacteraceae bacterium]
MDSFAPAPRAPRAVAGVPVVDAGEVTKAWLLELVAAAPLEAAAALPTGELVDFGPALATAVVEALRDDAALARLAPGGELGALAARTGVLVGASEPAAVIAAVESLRRAVLASMLAAARLDAVTTAELVDRLAHICTLIATTALSGATKAEKKAKKRRAEAADSAAERAPLVVDEPAPAMAQPPPAEPIAAAEPGPLPPRAEPPATAPPVASQPEPQPAAEPPPVPRVVPAMPPAAALPPFEPFPQANGDTLEVHRVDDPLEALRVRQARQAEPLSWRQAVEWRIKRHLQDGSPFALLAVEVDNVARLLAADEGGEVGGLLADLERALAAELRPADQLLRDDEGRYWVTAPDTGPAVARLLAERLAESAGAAASHRGVPLRVSIGVASCPEDGIDADELAGRADRGLFAARAAGTTVA